MQPDYWSDVDVAVVVAEGAMGRFFPGGGWLAPLGELFVCHARAEASCNVLQVCFTDGRRIDIKLIDETVQAVKGEFRRSKDDDAIIVEVCERLNMNMLLINPLFRTTLISHIENT
jgi:hypothetical protein